MFSCGTIPNGNFEEIAALGQSAYDLIILETEHVGFDFPTLRHSLQYLLNRKRLVEKGTLQPDVVPLVRIPPYTRERNAWVIKQTLDAGPFGLVLPHLDSVEGAEAAVRAARYPQVPGAPDFEPEGERGWASALAPTYWGLSPQDYCEAADVWPLDPDGELLLMGIVENVRGINALPDILRQVKGIGAIWAGPGDLSVSMGLRGNATHPDVEAGVQQILAMCQNAGVPCATGTTPAISVETRLEQGFRIVITPPTRSLDNLHRGRQAAGRGA